MNREILSGDMDQYWDDGFDRDGEDDSGPSTAAELADERLLHAVNLCLSRAGLPATQRTVGPLMRHFSATKRDRPTLVALAADLQMDAERTREIADAITQFLGNK